MITNLLAGLTDGYLPTMVNAMGGGVLDYQLKAENILRKSGMDYTILRSGELFGHHNVRFFNFPS